MRLTNFGEVEKQKDLLESALLLLENFRTDVSPTIGVIIGNRSTTWVVDEALRVFLTECLTQYTEVVKRRLTNLGVEL